MRDLRGIIEENKPGAVRKPQTVYVSKPATPDFRVQHTGSNFVILHPLTDAAEDWLSRHTDPEATWWAGGIVVEHRYIHDIVEGIIDDGFEVA